jgi:hypothetical protein
VIEASGVKGEREMWLGGTERYKGKNKEFEELDECGTQRMVKGMVVRN